MAYGSLVRNSLKHAYASLKDLAVPCVFTKTANHKFNFNTASPTADPSTTVTAKGVVTLIKKRAETSTAELMLLKSEVGVVSQYTTVAFNGGTWQISNTIHDDGYLLLLEVSRSLAVG